MKPYYEQDGITIYHGDCQDILPALGVVDVVLTDPPYTQRTHSNAKSNRMSARGTIGNAAIKFDCISDEDLRSALSACGQVSNGWVISTLDYNHAFMFDADPPDGLVMLRVGVWVKTNPMPQISADRPAQGWEAIAYLHRSDTKPCWNGGGKAGNYILPVYQGEDHPTSKPPSMIQDMIGKFSNPGDTILDPFMGGGTTIRCAKNMNRKAIGIDIDEHWCEIAAKRLQQSVLDLGV